MLGSLRLCRYYCHKPNKVTASVVLLLVSVAGRGLGMGARPIEAL